VLHPALHAHGDRAAGRQMTCTRGERRDDVRVRAAHPLFSECRPRHVPRRPNSRARRPSDRRLAGRISSCAVDCFSRRTQAAEADDEQHHRQQERADDDELDHGAPVLTPTHPLSPRNTSIGPWDSSWILTVKPGRIDSAVPLTSMWAMPFRSTYPLAWPSGSVARLSPRRNSLARFSAPGTSFGETRSVLAPSWAAASATWEAW